MENNPLERGYCLICVLVASSFFELGYETAFLSLKRAKCHRGIRVFYKSVNVFRHPLRHCYGTRLPTKVTQGVTGARQYQLRVLVRWRSYRSDDYQDLTWARCRPENWEKMFPEHTQKKKRENCHSRPPEVGILMRTHSHHIRTSLSEVTRSQLIRTPAICPSLRLSLTIKVMSAIAETREKYYDHATL